MFSSLVIWQRVLEIVVDETRHLAEKERLAAGLADTAGIDRL